MATIRRLLTVLALFGLVGLGTGAGLALGEPPQRLNSDIVDRVEALGGGTGAVRGALDRLRQETGLQLFVVYVSRFDGADGQEWAAESARRSQLGARDALLAVAVDDGVYGLSVADGFPVDESTVQEVAADDVEPRLAGRDWAGAAVALADGLRQGGSSGGGSSGGGTGDGGATPWIVGGTLALIGGAYAVDRRRRRQTSDPGPTASPAPEPRSAPDEFDGVATTDLSYRGSAALLELDDAVRTSEQELDLAKAQFGEAAVTGFRAALAASRAEMVGAFEVRQQLDDGIPEDDAQQRRMLAEIIRACRGADERLDAQAEAFDRLRDLDRTVPEVIAGLTPALDAAAARLPGAEQQLAELRAGYGASALVAVAENLTQARSRLAVARTEVGEAQTALAGGRRGEAVVSTRAAEDALAQAGTLLDGVARLADDLTEAGTRIADARAEVEADLAEARTLGSAGELPAAVARAEAALVAAERDLAARDPLAALRRLAEAAAALDAGLAQAREDKVRDERAAAGLDRALLGARSAVAAAADFITTRRGAVGAAARTRLAEAQRHLDIAAGRATTAPAAALDEARQADNLAQEALRLARSDVEDWSAPQPSPRSGFGGSTGVGGGGNVTGVGGGGNVTAAIDLGSLILGGILFGDDRGRGGAFGGGGYGGRRDRGGGGGFSPGSFGGSATRGRRGTGGRF